MPLLKDKVRRGNRKENKSSELNLFL